MTKDTKVEFKNPALAGDSSPKAVISIRVPPHTYDWLKAESKSYGGSMSETAYRIFDDLEHWFGMAKYQAQILTADRTKLGMGWRDYLTYLLTRRYEAVQAKGPAYDLIPPGGQAGR